MTDIKYHSSANSKCTCIMKCVFRNFVRSAQSFSQNLLDVVPTACVIMVYLLHMKVKVKGDVHPKTGHKGPEGE